MPLLNKKQIYSMLNDSLLIVYPKAKNPYQAAKMHLESLKETLCETSNSSKDYDLIVSEIIYFEWYIKSDDIAIMKKLNIINN